MNPLAAQPSTSSSPSHDTVSAAAAALRGASLAFQKKPPALPPKKADNGALTAATSVGRSRSPGTLLGPQHTGESDAEVAARLQSPGQLHPGFSGAGKVDYKSPSFIAATLAASRSASPSPKARTPRRESMGGVSSASSGEVVDSGSIAPTGSLISMFEQVRAGGGDPVKRPSPRRTQTESTDERDLKPVSPVRKLMVTKPTLKPKPMPRPISPPQPQIISRSTPEVLSPKPKRLSKPQLRPVTPPPQIVTRAATQEFPTPPSGPVKQSPKARQSPVARQHPPTPPKPRGSTKPTVEKPLGKALEKADGDQGPTVKRQRSKPQIGGKKKRPVEVRQRAVSASSDDTFVSASSVPSPERASPPLLPKPRQPAISLPPSPTKDIATTAVSKTTATGTAAPPPPQPRRSRPTKSSSTTNLPLDSLTNAIMASSLASARLTPHNTGGSLAAPPLPKRQKSPRLMQTLRQPTKVSDEDLERERHKKGTKGHLSHKLHSGKHAHHEGSRRKWREEITPRERKRYEAVWASNRGVLLEYHNPQNNPQTNPHRLTGGAAAQALGPVVASAAVAAHVNSSRAATNRPDLESGSESGVSNAKDYSSYSASDSEIAEHVVNVVVREIWKRSRLPADELAEVWDLVDRRGLGMLGRTEFVVGMWLIDQRLRGRKIPAKVSDSVWGSANGVKMKHKVK